MNAEKFSAASVAETTYEDISKMRRVPQAPDRASKEIIGAFEFFFFLFSETAP